VALVGVAVAGCGEISNTITPSPGTANVVTVMLAGKANGFYVGLYDAEALGYFKQSDIDLEIEVPSAGQDPVALLHAGKVLVAFASTPTVLLHRNQSEPVVGIAAITHSPLSAIEVPSTGSSTGTCSGGPSGGTALTTTTATTTTATSSAAPTTSTPTVTTATTTTPTCTTTSSGTTATSTTQTAPSLAATTTTGTGTGTSTTPSTTRPASEPDSSLWPPALRKLLKGSGVPTYDGLVVVARKGTIVDHAPLLRRFVQALARGYRAARANPVNAVQNLIVQVPALAASEAQQLATVNAAMPFFFPAGIPVWGYQREAVWNAFGEWMLTNHVISNANAITDASTNELLQGEGV
jgi:ABC-type nitrate/sulfonate/bicarbonate transport system substrate-binding protein